MSKSLDRGYGSLYPRVEHTTRDDTVFLRARVEVLTRGIEQLERDWQSALVRIAGLRARLCELSPCDPLLEE